MATPSGANAPYKIQQRGTKWVVVNNTGAIKATFDSEEKARDYQKALYANVNGAAKRASKVSFSGKAKDRVKALFDELVREHAAKRESVTMSDGKYPISDQHSANSAWKLRNHSDTHSEAEVVAHIRRACSKLGLHFPGDNARQQAADMNYMLKPHGFVFPAGMPNCAVCGDGANMGAHVNPPRTSQTALALQSLSWGGIRREVSADKHHMRSPRRTHVYTTGQAGWLSNIPCQACGQKMGASAHIPGMPCGPGGSDTAGIQVSPQTAALADPGAGEIVMVKHKFEALEGQSSIGDDYKMCAHCGFPEDDAVHELDADGEAQEPSVVVKQVAQFVVVDREPANDRSQTDVPTVPTQRAFVTQLNGKVILSAPASVFSEPDDTLPRELAMEWQRASAANPHFMWLEGRYVEADRPNRNMAAWSADDLELGEPTVAHGPINMLHEERHIIGTVAAAKLVVPERQAASSTVEPSNIRALGAIWRYLYPMESRQIARYSDERKLWYSMECVSREVACLADGCSHLQSYADYMKAKHTRCQHVKEGGPRRFVDPHFLGGAIIIPPIRPGWGGANATVMRQAAMLAERQQASFDGLTTSEAELMVAQIIDYATGDSA